MNRELPDVQAGFRKGKGNRDQISIIRWIIKKAREFQKKHLFLLFDYAKAFDCVDHNKVWKILKEMGIPDHLTCLLRNLYAGQEATVRTGHGPTDWFQIGKEYVKAVYCHPVYLTLNVRRPFFLRPEPEGVLQSMLGQGPQPLSGSSSARSVYTRRRRCETDYYFSNSLNAGFILQYTCYYLLFSTLN